MAMKYNFKNFIAVIIGLAFLGSSCGIYTFSPSALGGIKSIAIPTFENRTTEYGLDDLLTQGVSQAFVSNNTLKVVPEAQADVIMKGAIISYSQEPYTYTTAENVQEYRCTIGLDIKVGYANSDKVLWEDSNLSDYGIYSITDGETQTDGDDRAVSKLIDEIINRTVKSW
jgi:hypothetical protein